MQLPKGSAWAGPGTTTFNAHMNLMRVVHRNTTNLQGGMPVVVAFLLIDVTSSQTPPHGLTTLSSL